MPVQPGTFKRLPPEDELLALIEEERQHNADLTSYLWYVMPLADRFGSAVYNVAADALKSSGLDVDASQLQQLAGELKTPEGRERFAEHRRRHMRHVTG